MSPAFTAYRERNILVTSELNKEAYSTNFGQGMPGLGGANTFMAPPKFYSPVHTPSNWQIPQKRQEVYVWCRFFASMEPKVAAALDFYSQFPTCSGYDNVCKDPVIKEYFDDVKRKLKIEDWLEIIAYEYFTIGDVFIFASINCPHCGGTGVHPQTGERCNHAGGTFSGITVLNPDWIEIKHIPHIDEELVFLMPDENLTNIVTRQEPREIFDRIPDAFKEAILTGNAIPLNPLCVTHLAHSRSSYQPYGKSIIYRLFTTLAYKDKVRQAQWAIADRHIIPIRIVKVGSDRFPASSANIQDVTAQVYNAINDPNFTLVTHHAFDYDFIGANGKVLQLGKEYDLITEEILDGLMINKALLNSEGPSYSNASIGIEAMNKRLSSLRRKLAYMIEEKIYRPIAEMQGFVDKNESGEYVPIYPQVKWKDLNLRDDSSKKNLMMSLADKKYISVQTLLEYLDIDFDTEIDRLRMEKVLLAEYGIGEQEEGGNLDLGGGGGFGGGGGGLGGGGGAFDFGDHGTEGAGPNDVNKNGPGTPGGGPGGDLSAPQSMPSQTFESSWLKNYEGLPTRYKMPNVIKGNNFRNIKSRIDQEKQALQRQAQELITSQSNQEPTPLPFGALTRPEAKMYEKFQQMYAEGSLKYAIRPQYKISNTRMRIDFAFPQIGLAIEVDGSQHDTRSQREYDAKKDFLLRKNGWHILRFSDRQVMDSIDEVEHVISEFIKQREESFKKGKVKE